MPKNAQVKVKVKSLSRVRLFATPWTVAHQAPLSMGFPRQEYWSGLPFPSPGDLPRDRTQVSCIAGRRFNLNYHTIALISHSSKVMLKILQARLQQYVNCEDQIANILWIMEKAREFQKNIDFCFIDYAKALDCVDHDKLWKIL